MEDDWWPIHEFDSSELSYGIPANPENISSLVQKILDSPYVDRSEGFDLEILLDLSQLDDELLENNAEDAISSLARELRGPIELWLEQIGSHFNIEGDMTGWEDEGYGIIIEYTEDITELIEIIKAAISQKDLFEYCTLGISFCLVPVSQLSDDPEFNGVCEEIEKRTGGKFSIRGTAELEPYDGVEVGSSFYQVFLIISPLYEFPLQFFRGHSEDNRLASPYYNYVFSKICRDADCRFTLLKT